MGPTPTPTPTKSNGQIIVEEALGFGIFIDSGALAAVALSNPIGAAGGAAAGCIGYLLNRPVQYLCTKAFNADQKTASTISKIVAAVAGFFATAAATMGISAALGYSMTFGAACLLSLVTGGIAIGIVIAAFIVIRIAALILDGIQAAMKPSPVTTTS